MAPYRFPFTVELKLTGPENIGHVSWPEEEFNITRDPLSPEEETTLLRMKTIVFQMRCLAWIVWIEGSASAGLQTRADVILHMQYDALMNIQW